MVDLVPQGGQRAARRGQDQGGLTAGAFLLVDGPGRAQAGAGGLGKGVEVDAGSGPRSRPQGLATSRQEACGTAFRGRSRKGPRGRGGPRQKARIQAQVGQAGIVDANQLKDRKAWVGEAPATAKVGPDPVRKDAADGLFGVGARVALRLGVIHPEAVAVQRGAEKPSARAVRRPKSSASSPSSPASVTARRMAPRTRLTKRKSLKCPA